MLIDARGLDCPKPVSMAEEALRGMGQGAVEVLVDNEMSADNLVWFANKSGYSPDMIRVGNAWRVRIVKGEVCGTPVPFQEKQAEKRLMLIVGTDSLGKEEELGKMLVKGLFETMKVTREMPDSIFFLNAGVRLTTVNEETIPVLKELEGMGVEIFSCGTCLKYYGLESEMKVGYRGTTNHIVEGLSDFKKVVWI